MDTHKIIIAFLAASSIALGVGSAVAGGRGHDCGGHAGFFAGHHGKEFPRGERWREAIQSRQERLHKALKLSAAQEPAWAAFIQKAAPGPDSLKRPDPEASRKLTTPERAEKLLELSGQHQAFLKDRLEALKTFYAVLTPEQKQVFDEFHSGPQGRKDKRGAHKEKRESKKN